MTSLATAAPGIGRGRGYVHPVEAADEILDEVLEPFLGDLERRAALGMAAAATELAMGVLLGLYRCRHAESETVLEYARTTQPSGLRSLWTGARNSTSTCLMTSLLIS